jgi:hypothetical protein
VTFREPEEGGAAARYHVIDIFSYLRLFAIVTPTITLKSRVEFRRMKANIRENYANEGRGDPPGFQAISDGAGESARGAVPVSIK